MCVCWVALAAVVYKQSPLLLLCLGFGVMAVWRLVWRRERGMEEIGANRLLILVSVSVSFSQLFFILFLQRKARLFNFLYIL